MSLTFDENGNLIDDGQKPIADSNFERPEVVATIPDGFSSLPAVAAPTKEHTIFEHSEFGSLRVIKDEVTGEPWFVAKDICRALAIQTFNVRSILDGDEVREVNKVNPYSVYICSSGRGRMPLAVSEPGLYSLILRSRKPEARQFKRWVTHEVLPAIRKHGGYLTPKLTTEALTDPDVIINLALQLKAERQKAREH
ncbi:hypothetical protein LJC46_08415 [Desulfovibrio sp. OttesenSCG-928-G15]|nr:hypothetical protein [Desulfovibrio sp. OttesenSCG-928-G15]